MYTWQSLAGVETKYLMTAHLLDGVGVQAPDYLIAR